MATKFPKWRIGVTIANHYMVEVDAPTEKEALQGALNAVREDGECYLSSVSRQITSVFINDRESKDFALYVPETYPTPKAEGT